MQPYIKKGDDKNGLQQGIQLIIIEGEGEGGKR